MAIQLTDRAARRIFEIVGQETRSRMLRVSVKAGGCSGFQYAFDLVDDREMGDYVIEKEGAVVLIDDVSYPHLNGCEIDFVDDLIGASFKISNPNATSSCGCGTSFSV
jgi:iron-sulfur cluster assembly accessory protein